MQGGGLVTLSSAGGRGAKNAPFEVSERNLFALAEASASPARPAPGLPQACPLALSSGSSALPARTVRFPTAPRLKPLLRRLGHAASQACALEMERGAGFLLVPVFLSVGVVVYFSMSHEPRWSLLAGLTGALALLAWIVRRRHKAYLCCLAFLLCLSGAGLSKFQTWRLDTRVMGSDIAVRLTGRVVEIEDMASGRKRLTIDVVSTERPKLRYRPERVRISARNLPSDISAGSDVAGLVRLLPPSGPIRPESYDTSFSNYFGGIGASGFFLSGPKLSVPTAAPLASRLSAAIERGRQAVAGRIRHSIGGPEGEIAAALIVGVRAGIPEEINEAMRKTGIYHIISISGLHMALVAGTVMGLMRGLFAAFPDFSSRHPVKKYAALTALFAILAYLLISGMVVAAVRSFIMLAVMLVAVLFDRSALTMRNLAISAIIVILVTPHEVVGPSFQMSFAATAALVGAYAAWADYKARRPVARISAKPGFVRSLMRALITMMAGLAATSVVAGLATTLYAAWHFQRIAPLSLLANLAVMPVVSIIVMPFAVFASLAMPFGLDAALLQIMGKGLTAVIFLSERIADMSPVDAIGLIPPVAVLLATIALVIATMTTTWLRLAALPFAMGSLVTLGSVRTPDILISEDARLIAVAMENGEVAVNRPRPNAFTIDNWGRAMDAETLLPPKRVRQQDEGAFLQGLIAPVKGETEAAGFVCSEKICAARSPSGLLVVQARDAGTAGKACAHATLIVIEDATARNPCRKSRAIVVTRRELARKGSAEVYLEKTGASPVAAAVGKAEPGIGELQIRFAIEGDYRPWHTQRRYSREARGLPPYERKIAAASVETSAGSVSDQIE